MVKLFEVTMRDSAEIAVQLDGVTVRLGKRTVLNDINVEFKLGDITGILGPNGAGKTNLLHTITGLRRLQSGRATVLGQPIPPSTSGFRHRIGVVFQ